MKLLRTTLLVLGSGYVALAPLSADAKGSTPSTNAGLVTFSAPESIKRLERSRHKVDFFHLANQFESQGNKAFCGPTSSVIVLNALRMGNDAVAKPQDPSLVTDEDRKLLPAGFDPLFHRYTQNNFFDTRVQEVKTRAEVFGQPRGEGAKSDAGIQLRQLAGMLAAQGLDVKLRVLNDSLKDATMREELKQNLKTEGDYVIINYSRPLLGQQGSGHISPLAAYDQKSDSFLVMDVNATDQRWVWVKAPALFASMRSPDVQENRGYLLVKEGKTTQARETP
ncbi:phytochelatin synthase [Pyxidicoccus fallax]|uniref:glutathione gamma-glutamylcysteinyltransferase n=1 Tax=Pyxidicoccus fallax TaxID=394095 RepID=A0A848LLA6_9BACT|nr:phytochelatin synthase family protein [Pyxidicoccus fallax]NMO18597.1 phytochelatin synthase [Pyxidicoccus fallax]NPC82395.1 phytochelatin synthase [Pyxidicoccus fallax]